MLIILCQQKLDIFSRQYRILSANVIFDVLLPCQSCPALNPNPVDILFQHFFVQKKIVEIEICFPNYLKLRPHLGIGQSILGISAPLDFSSLFPL